MSCEFSREHLALFIEDDLPHEAAASTARHLAGCDECRQFADRLRATQSRLKTLRHDVADPADCLQMRRDVMAMISSGHVHDSWWLRLERALTMGMRRRAYAFAGVALIAGISVSLTMNMPHAAARAETAGGVFVEGNTLRRPEGYREWVALDAARTSGSRVYVAPEAYRVYERSGQFPDGTLMVWEAAKADGERGPHGSASFLASVKDNARFDGWAYFDFSSADGRSVSKAEALPESSGCRNCHRKA